MVEAKNYVYRMMPDLGIGVIKGVKFSSELPPGAAQPTGLAIPLAPDNQPGQEYVLPAAQGGRIVEFTLRREGNSFVADAELPQALRYTIAPLVFSYIGSRTDIVGHQRDFAFIAPDNETAPLIDDLELRNNIMLLGRTPEFTS